MYVDTKIIQFCNIVWKNGLTIRSGRIRTKLQHSVALQIHSQFLDNFSFSLSQFVSANSSWSGSVPPLKRFMKNLSKWIRVHITQINYFKCPLCTVYNLDCWSLTNTLGERKLTYIRFSTQEWLSGSESCATCCVIKYSSCLRKIVFICKSGLGEGDTEERLQCEYDRLGLERWLKLA